MVFGNMAERASAPVRVLLRSGEALAHLLGEPHLQRDRQLDTANGAMALEAHFGPMRIGAILVMLNTRLASAELEWILHHSGAKVLLVDPQLKPLIDLPQSRRLLYSFQAPDETRSFDAVTVPQYPIHPYRWLVEISPTAIGNGSTHS